MDNYLKTICTNLGIMLIYNSNKIKVLSAEIKNNIPLIRAHKIFRSCPYTVAKAAINYYIDTENRKKYEKILLEYLNKQINSNLFKIIPLDLDFKSKIVQTLPVIDTIDNNTSLIEFDIVCMSVKDFWGNEKKYDYNEKITPKNDDFLELNIVINSNT